MTIGLSGRRALGLAAAVGLAAAGLALAVSPAPASAAGCPSVDPTTHVVSPAPAPGVDWNGCDLAGATLYGADLSGASLVSADLSNADLTAARLVSADLTDADLIGVSVYTANFSNATLTGVRSGGIATPQQVFLPAPWLLVSGYLAGPGANLSGASLASAPLASADLTGANLSGTNLQGASLSSVADANLTSAYLYGAHLYLADLTGADLSDANLSWADLFGATLTGADMAGTTLAHVASGGITGSPLSLPAPWLLRDGCLIGPGALLANASLTGANLSNADLAGANLTHAYLSTASFVNSNLTGADLTGADASAANFSQANLTSATLSGTSLSGAIWSSTTCPDGSNSDKYVDGCFSPLDTTPPTVTVTGVGNLRQYILGAVPSPGCKTTDDSAVAVKATLAVTTTGAHAVGSFTATCSGAVDRAGNKQAAAVKATYTVVYGFGGFRSPVPGSTVAKSARTIKVRFRFANAEGTAISGSIAAALAAGHKVRVTLAGPNINPVTATCGWNTTARVFACSIKIPAGVRTGQTRNYKITVAENVGTGFLTAPGVGGGVNPETIHFK